MIAMTAGQWPEVDPTPAQVRLSRFVMKYRDEHGYSPTQKEMADAMKVKQPWINELIDGVVALGLFAKESRKRRSLKPTTNGEQLYRDRSNTSS